MTIADPNPSMDERPDPWPSLIEISSTTEGPSRVRGTGTGRQWQHQLIQVEALNELDLHYTTMK